MDILSGLITLNLGEVHALIVYMAYASNNADLPTFPIRARRFLEFAQWASGLDDFVFDYALLPKFAQYLSLKNSPSTVAQKVSMVRQFLLAAESMALIPKCVYYQKRGRKPREGQTQMVYVGPSKDNLASNVCLKASHRFRKTYLIDLFGIPADFSTSTLKRAYKQVATLVHPDHDGGSHEAFCACREAYDFLSDRECRESYLRYVHGEREDDAREFSRGIFCQMGGIEVQRMAI